MQKKHMIPIFAGCLAFLLILVAGCTSTNASGLSSTDTGFQTVTLNVCITDPENADLWVGGPVNLWDAPGESRTKKVGELDACKNIPVMILEESGEYIKIKSGSQKGWVLKEIVMGVIDSDDDKAFHEKSKTTSLGLTNAMKSWTAAVESDDSALIHQTSQALLNEIDSGVAELKNMPVTTKMEPIKQENLLSWSEMREGIVNLDSALQYAEKGDNDAAKKSLNRAQVLLGNYSAHDDKAEILYAELYPAVVERYSTIQETSTESIAKYKSGDIAGGGTGGNWYYAAIKSYNSNSDTYVYYDLPEYTKSSSQYFGTTKLGNIHTTGRSSFEQKYPNLYFTGRSMP